MNVDLLMIGHICRDKNTDHLGHTEFRAGGAVLYSSAAAEALGYRAAVVTKTAPEDADLIRELTLPPERVFALPGKTTTRMENTYLTPDKERRRSVCAARGEAFQPDEIPSSVHADVYQLAGLVFGDYTPDMIPFLSKQGKVAVDVQGYLRHVNAADGGSMYFADWEEKKTLLPYIDFLKTDAAEAEILTGTTDRASAAALLHEWGAREILITHNTEVLLYADSKTFTCPIRSRSFAGRTGRGDTTFAAYLGERLTQNPAEALRFATAAVSLKMETPGPFMGSRADVEAYIQAFYTE